MDHPRTQRPRRARRSRKRPGWSKWLAEGIHRAWRDEDPTRRLVIVRPGAIFGPGEGGNFTRMARLLERGLFVFPGRTDTTARVLLSRI